ncbi:hypothetical protein D3C78_1559320 [compost metagenome]
MRVLDLTRRLVRSFLDGLSLNKDQWKDQTTEWVLLAFIADLMRQIRTGKLTFPEDANSWLQD